MDFVITPGDLVADAPYAVAAFLWAAFVVVFLSKKVYEHFLPKWGHRRSAYLARKVIHFLAGGLVALALPFLFREPLLPFAIAMVFTVMTYIPHRTGRLMHWFQVEDNIAEVYFTLLWGVVVLLFWYVNIWLAVVPILFMAWGDGITGIVRNIKYKRRTKAWEGNLAMFLLSAPIGYYAFGAWGVLAALVSSIVERFEVIDDNISVPLSSAAILAAALAMPK